MKIDDNNILISNEDYSEWINNFPYEEPRNQQKKVINEVLSEFKKGKKFADDVLNSLLLKKLCLSQK